MDTTQKQLPDTQPADPDSEMTDEEKEQDRTKRLPAPKVKPGTPDPRVRMTDDDRIRVPR